MLASILIVITALPASGDSDDLTATLKKHALPLQQFNDLAPLIDRAGSAKLVLLGESTHGTSEFYLWRSEISKRLISEKGFSFIAVEGDWPGCYEINRYIKQLPGAASSAVDALRSFRRWPQWMWANQETAELVEWLRDHNAELPPEQRVGFFGFDVYSLPESIDIVLDFARGQSNEFRTQVEAGLAGIMRFRADPIGYSRYTMFSEGYAAEVEAVLSLFLANSEALSKLDRKAYFKALQNAFVIRNSERYYRAIGSSGDDSWNKRVEHMKATITRLLDHHGDSAKAILWAHNTHIGDARATGMAKAGMKNIGWLTRAKFGSDQVYAVGFATFHGQVLAGSQWGAPVATMPVPPARVGSIEKHLSLTGLPALMLFPGDKGLARVLSGSIPHRAIGVVYNPDNEAGNYVGSVLSRRYNAFIFINTTQAVNALDFTEVRPGTKEEAATVSKGPSELFKDVDWHKNKWQSSPAIIEISAERLNLLFNRPEIVFGLRRAISFAWNEEHRYSDGKVATTYRFRQVGEDRAQIDYQSVLETDATQSASGSFVIDARR